MRKLVWFTLGFGIACGISAYFIASKLLIFLPLLCWAAGLLLFRKHYIWKRISVLLLGICAGFFWFSCFQNNYLKPVYDLDGLTQKAQIRCSAYSEKTDYGNRAEARLTIRGKNYPVMVYLDEEITPEPGTVLSGEFLFRVTAPEGKKESSYYQGEGIFLLAYQKGEPVISHVNLTWTDYPAVLRQRFLKLLEQSLSEDSFAFSKALLLGDSSSLSYDTLTNFSVSGIRHIIAVSGLHVSILFGILGMVTFRKRFVSFLIGFPVLLLFAAMTGFTPSVCRACIMSGLMLLASVLNREYDGFTALAFAGLTLLVVNPLVIQSVSYQLSFASVAGILSLTPGIYRWLQSLWKVPKERKVYSKVIQGFTLSVSVTLGATVATVPLSAAYFGTVSLVAVLTNLLVLWSVSLIFYGLLVMCLLGLMWPAAGIFFGKILTFLIRYVLLISGLAADFPLAALYTRSPYITAWLVFAYLLLAVFLLQKNKKPFELTSCLTIGLCCALLASWSEPGRSEVRFTVLDVGQGQCLLMQTEGRTYMVDCGGSTDAIAADAAAETLFSQGISKLDCLILTHLDQDHAGGVANFLSRISVEMLILPPVYSDFQPQADHVLYAWQDMTISSEETNVTVYSSGNPRTGNENSLCILFDTKNCDILITGDRSEFGERMLMRRTDLKDVDVLVAGHHGAKDSTGDALLEKVQPEIVCISVGKENRYGHPNQETLQRLDFYGCDVYRTDLHGDIIIRR